MIDPITTNTARVGELPNEPFSLSDKIPHEVGIDLKSGTVQQLVDLVASVIDTTGGVGFRAVSVTDGQTLPATTTQEFILLGKGTYYNVSGGDTIVLTKELNAVVSNGSFWFIGVEIDINAEDLGIVQTIRQGFIETAPSENAIYNAIEIINSALSSKENTIAAGTTAQYYRGDKTFQNLDKTAVGLANVDNTSDLNKPVSTATQTALNAKQNTISGATNYLAKFASGGVSTSTIYDNAAGVSFGGSTAFGGYEFLKPAFGSNTIYIGTPDGVQNPRAYISHQTVLNQPQKVILGSAFTSGQDTASWYLENGNLVIGTLSNNNVDKLQVNGTISASPAITPNQVTTKSQLDLKADLASPALTGVPTAPTATAGTNTTQVATTAFVLANSQAIPHLESNATDLTVWNNGKGNVQSNTSFGDGALRTNTSGNSNSSLGVNSLALNTTGSANTAIGSASLNVNLTGVSNVAVGSSTLLQNTTGGGNVAIGVSAGSSSGLTNSSTSLFIGRGSLPLGNNQDNQIVIGDSAIGAGSNTATLGNASIIRTILSGIIQKRTLDAAPTSATDTGTLGEIRVTTTHIYVCTATNTWARTALSSW